jgi:peptide/nickel transport system permease protein
MVLMAIFAPFMHTTNPLNPDYGALNAGPSGSHWFGTDGLGRDLYSRIIYGLRVPLLVGIIGTFVTVAIGTTMGVCAGFYGGLTDGVLARITDAFFAFPAFLLALISVALFGTALDPYFGGAGRVLLLTIVFAGVSWPPLMRFVRSLALSHREQQYVEAAKTAGSSNFKIIRRHLLPNMYGLILVQAALITAAVVYTETTLSIFGLGVEPPDPDLGQMLYDAQQNLFANVPGGIYSEVIFTSIFLVTLLVAFTFVGDGVRDAVDPRMNS